LEPVDPTCGDVDLRLVEGARRRGGAEEDLTAPRVGLLLGDPCRIVEERGKVGQGHAPGAFPGTRREGGERVDREPVDLPPPRSVMIAVMSAAGVTSNAGLNTDDAAGAVCWAPTPRTSAGSRSSIGIASPDGSVGSIVENGAAT